MGETTQVGGPEAGVRLQWGIQIPMRDGVLLNATLYTPAAQTGASPVVFAVTPYISDSYHPIGLCFAAHGLPFVIVDVRGRGNSGGAFDPFVNDARDGFDVVEWLAVQPYCNGKVAMWGGSYSGHSQWVTAQELPPHLATIVPAAAPFIGVDFPMRNNIPYPYLLQWITSTAGRTAQARIFADMTFWSATFRRWYESGRAFRELDQVAGNPSALFQEWLDHPEPDSYWDARNPTPAQYSRITIPVMTITGSYDDDQPGALEHYRAHLRNCSAARHYLVIGPWDHAGTCAPKAAFGGLQLGPNSVIDIQKLHLEWYQWTMGAGPRPTFLTKAVVYYVMEADRWRSADTLEEITARYDRYFLDSDHNATDVFCAGTLGTEPGGAQPDSYEYDPQAVGPEVDAEAQSIVDSIVDQRVTFALRGRQLIYHTAPFEADTEVSGFFRLDAWISIDCPDTDIYAFVYEVTNDGRAVRLTTDAVRARYRQGLRTPNLIRDTTPLLYEFTRFTFVSRRVRRGHRLRLVIAPVGRLIDAHFWQKNYNGGGVVSAETAGESRLVTVRLFHDDACPSALFVPIGVED